MNVTVLGTTGRAGTAVGREPARLGTVTEQFRVVQPSVSRLLCPVANRYLTRAIRPLHVEDLRPLKRLEQGR
jgi:hypothetical protein